MRKRRFEFSAQEQGQMMIDKLIADKDLDAGLFQVNVGARMKDGDMFFWIDVDAPSQPQKGEKP